MSDRQWRDIVGVLHIQKGRFDVGYTRHWARHLGVDELLERALRDAGV